LHAFIRILRQSGIPVSLVGSAGPVSAGRRLPPPTARAAPSLVPAARAAPAASLRSAHPGLYGRPAAYLGSPGRLVFTRRRPRCPRVLNSGWATGRPPGGRALRRARGAAVVGTTARPWSGPGAGSPAGRAYMTFMSVNGTSLRPGPRQRHRPWVLLYRRVCIAFGNLTRQAGRRRVPGVSDITEMRPIRNPPETYPGDRDNIVSMPLTCGDAPLVGWSGPGAKPGKPSLAARC
jgi:hypothetical protein